MKYVSQREFARQVGVSHVWINRLVRDGRLPANARRQIPLEEGKKAFEASQQAGYDANREHGEAQRKAGRAAKRPQAAQQQEQDSADDDDVDMPMPTQSTSSIARVSEAFNKARLAEKTYQAKLKELEYKEARGELIPVDEVRQDAAAAGAEIRGKLAALPSRIAAQCEGKSAREIEGIIEGAINEALEALRKARFKG